MTCSPPVRSSDALAAPVAAGVFAATAVTAATIAAPAPHWLDASEFAAAAHVLGNAHPPGHPLAVTLGKAATLLPLGSLGFRANLASAIALGVAAVLALFLARRLLLAVTQEAPSRPVTWSVSAAAALGLCLGPAALLQGVRAEVYALQLAVGLGLVLLALRYLEAGRLRDLLGAGLLGGLGLGNHHLLTAAAGTAVLGAVLWRHGAARRPGLGRIAAAALAALLGALVLLHLPARSRRAPPVNWGAPHTADRFLWTVSAKLFQRTAQRSVRASPLASAGRLARALGKELGLGVGLALLAGIVLLLRARLAGTLLVLGLAASATAAAAILAGFDPLNPDSHGYVLLLLACGVALAAGALGAGLHRLARSDAPRWLVPTLAAGVALWPLQSIAGSLPRADLREAYGAQVAAETLLDAVPPGGLALTSYYQTGFGLWAAQLLSGARPDVDHVHRTFLGQPGYVENRLRADPALGPLLAGVRSPEALDARRLRREARRRPVYLEFDDDTVGPALVGASLDRGGWIEVLPPEDPRGRRRQTPAEVARALAPLRARLAPYRRDPLTRMWLLWVSYLDARYHRLRGECDAAQVGFALAAELGDPKDPLLRRLARACGLRLPAPRAP